MKKFKIGDKVRVREDLLIDTFYDDGCKFTSDMEDTLGKVGEVVNNVGLIRYMVRFGSDDYYHSYCYSNSMLEPINEEKFKVGDKVRVRNDLLVDAIYDDGCKFIKEMQDVLGEVGEVIRIERNKGRVRYMVKFNFNVCYYPYYFSNSMLELVENEKGFKVGDRIKVKDNLLIDTFYDDGCKFISDMEYALGEAGKIVRIERNGRYVIKLDCEDYYHSYCYSPSMLEPMTKNSRMEIYRIDDDCPYDFLNKFWVTNREWAKVVIINNPEVIVIDRSFNIFKAKCHRTDIFNPEIGLEICCKKKRMGELKIEREKKAKDLALLEKIMKNLKEDLGNY